MQFIALKVKWVCITIQITLQIESITQYAVRSLLLSLTIVKDITHIMT